MERERVEKEKHVQQKKYLIVALAKHVEVPRDATRRVSRRFLRSGWRHRFGFAKVLAGKGGRAALATAAANSTSSR